MMQDWLGKTVDRDDLTRHDKWCCMMLPRLKLLRELLRQDGVIFISIDDNEVHNLRCLMDEVFGEENFVATDNLAEELLAEETRLGSSRKTMISWSSTLRTLSNGVQTSWSEANRQQADTRTRTTILAATGHRAI